MNAETTINSTLIVQLLVSFFAGGLLITVLSIIAESTNQHISGIVLMFPSTLVLGFFFLGLTTSPENVSSVIPATLIPLGIIVFSSVVYIYCSVFFENFIKNKIALIFCSLLSSVIIWVALVSPFAVYKFTNTFIGTCGFLIIITITYFILKSKKYEVKLRRPNYIWWQVIIRAIFTGSVIAAVILLSKILDPFWGGIFTMFPAATFATLIVLHFYYSPQELFYFMKNAPMGSLSLFTYTISIMLLFPRLGIWTGTLISYGISLAFGLLLVKFKSK